MFGCSLVPPALLLGFSLFSLSFAHIIGRDGDASSSSSSSLYTVIIDAGSSHSQAILYRWPVPVHSFESIQQVADCTVHRGISQYGADQLAASDLVHCLKGVLLPKLVPNSHRNVSLYLAATAGMRLYREASLNRTQKLLTTLQTQFESLGVSVKQVAIIPGTLEGVYAWIAANGAAGKLGTLGKVAIVEMGGASVQLAAELNESEVNLSKGTSGLLFGAPYSLDSSTNLCLGTKEALGRYVMLRLRGEPEARQLTLPCLSQDFRVNHSALMDSTGRAPCLRLRTGSWTPPDRPVLLLGTGDSAKCALEVNTLLLNQTECPFVHCFKGQEAPKKNDTVFYAVGGFTKMAQNLNLIVPFSRDTWMEMARKVCSHPISWQMEHYGVKGRFASKMCFQMVLAEQVLTTVYSFKPNMWQSQLRFEDTINGKDIGWALGLAAQVASEHP